MKLGIMQPYLFPYIGYFQLVACVDTFVIYDDVQFIKNGWINRNRILINGKPKYLTMPLKKDSTFLNINQRYFTPEFDFVKDKLLRKISLAYAKAPLFRQVIPLIEACFSCKDRNVSNFVGNSFEEICQYLAIDTPIIRSSALFNLSESKGQERVIEICQKLGADHYINAIGGVDIYDKSEFSKHGIELNFIKPMTILYPQFNNDFIPNLSIIDVMMFNDKNRIRSFFEKYNLI